MVQPYLAIQRQILTRQKLFVKFDINFDRIKQLVRSNSGLGAIETGNDVMFSHRRFTADSYDPVAQGLGRKIFLVRILG